jgi:hypothetical protein
MYFVSFENVTISAVQDLFSLKGSTGKLCTLFRLLLGMTNTTLQTAQGLRLNVKFSSATFTAGSGGTAPTPRPSDLGDTAASFTARANDTTQGTTSGAFTNIPSMGVHNFGGWDFSFPRPPVFGLNQAIIFELLSTVSGTCAFSGTAEVGEQGL